MYGVVYRGKYIVIGYIVVFKIINFDIEDDDVVDI